MIFEKLKNNKGTISSKLGKELADEVLAGNHEILKEAAALVCYELQDKKAKQIRAGAAKIIEKVAEKKPELISPYLNSFFPALDADEPQTRWMLIMAFGYCASLNSSEAAKGIGYARNYIREQAGVCLSGSAELYLGRIGAVSPEYSNKIFPILIEAYDSAAPNEIDWIFEAFIMISKHLSPEQKNLVAECAKEQTNAVKKSTQKRVEKLLKLING